MLRKVDLRTQPILDHEALIRSKPCVIMTGCFGDVIGHHMDRVGSKGVRLKDASLHFSQLPMCIGHHTEFHAMSLEKFEARYKINTWKTLATMLCEIMFEQMGQV